MVIKRGDIFFADLSEPIGSEQGGTRPVMVIQNNIANRFSPTVIVAAITAKISNTKLPTHVKLEAGKFNLQRDSIVLLEQIRTIDKMRLRDKIGSVSDDKEVMDNITTAFMISGSDMYSEQTSEYTQKNYLYILDKELNIYEDLEYEFKEIKGGNPKSSISSNVSEYATSFLNSQGGRILYGITNSGTVKGFKAKREQVDEIQRVIYDSLRTIEPPLSPDHYHLEFHKVYDLLDNPIKDLYVLEVIVPPSRDSNAIYFKNGKELHIRVKGVKQLLKGTEIVSFIQKKLLK